MADQDLTVNVALSDDQAKVTLCGELDEATSAQLKGVLGELVCGGRTELVIDVSNLTFIDSQGLNLLVSANKRLKARGGALVLVRPSAVIRRVFDITGMSALFSVVDVESAASLDRARGT